MALFAPTAQSRLPHPQHTIDWHRSRPCSRILANVQHQQQQQEERRLQLTPEARAAVYSLRRVNVGEALRRLEDPSLADEPLIGGTMLLHALAEQRDAAAVAALIPAALAAGADPNRPDSQGCTPLFYAANNREPAAAEAGLRLLLASGANANARALGGLTPLHTAARNGSPEAAAVAVRLLVEAGADLEAQLDSSAGGSRPLHMAVAANDSPAGMEAAVEALLAAGACIHARDSRSGATALHIAAARCSGGKAAFGAIRVLLQAGAATGAVDAEGRQALHLAIGTPATAFEAAEVLLHSGADPNAACLGSGGWRPLHATALLPEGHAAAQLVALLVNAGGRVDAADSQGSTALMWTALNSHQPSGRSNDRGDSRASGSNEPAAPIIAAALLDAGADVHARDVAGRQPLLCAAAAAAHNPAAPRLIATLIEAHADLEAQDATKQTPLQLAAAAAAQGGSTAGDAVQVLLEAGASAGPLLRTL